MGRRTKYSKKIKHANYRDRHPHQIDVKFTSTYHVNTQTIICNCNRDWHNYYRYIKYRK